MRRCEENYIGFQHCGGCAVFPEPVDEQARHICALQAWNSSNMTFLIRKIFVNLKKNTAMEIPILNDIVLIFAVSVFVSLLAHKFRIPVIIGLLITGILTGPYGFGLITNTHDIEILAEIGVILLLFSIGIEFSLKKLLRIKRLVLIGGSVQVIITIGVFYLIANSMGNSWNESVFIGFLVALSSTAIVMKIIQETGEVDSPRGQISLATLIFQDVMIVPMMMLVPILAGSSGDGAADTPVYFIILKVVAFIAGIIFLARWAVPKTLHQVARTQSHELFILSIILIAFAVAWLTSSIGLSLALGAFIAGIIISESDYSHHALGNILPFLAVFTSFFFVSIGMLLNLEYTINNLLSVVLITLSILILKTIIATFAAILLKYPLRIALKSGITISQVGEFSFILAALGLSEGLLGQDNYQLFLNVSVLSMAASPFLIKRAGNIADIILRLPMPDKWKHGMIITDDSQSKKENHLIIIGYGVNGRNVAAAARTAGIPYEIIEMNPETVKYEQSQGEPIHFGDATHTVVLDHSNIKKALVMVVTIPHPQAIRRITATARQLNPQLHIIIRARYLSDMKPLYQLGADEVIPEEFETSVEIFVRVLHKFMIPNDQIEHLVGSIRDDNYQMFRNLSIYDTVDAGLRVQAPLTQVHSLHVCENSPLINKSLKEILLIDQHKINILAISRENGVLPSPDKSEKIRGNDILFFLGSEEQKSDFINLFRNENSNVFCIGTEGNAK